MQSAETSCEPEGPQVSTRRPLSGSLTRGHRANTVRVDNSTLVICRDFSGRHWARTSDPSLSIRPSRSRPFAQVRLPLQTGAFRFVPFATNEPGRTTVASIASTESQAPKPPSASFAAALSRPPSVSPAKTVIVTLALAWRAIAATSAAVSPCSIAFGDKRVPEVVEADGLATPNVQTHVVACLVQGAERVSPRLRLAARRLKDELVGARACEVALAWRTRCSTSSRRNTGRSGSVAADETVFAVGSRSPASPSCPATVIVPAFKSTSRQRRPSASEIRRPAYVHA
jgi:hypothetical protein